MEGHADGSAAALKRLYTRTKSALAQAVKEQSTPDDAALVEWMFSFAEVHTLLGAAAAQIKAAPGAESTPALKRCYARCRTALLKAQAEKGSEEDSNLTEEWLFSCAEVRSLLSAAAAQIKAAAGGAAAAAAAPPGAAAPLGSNFVITAAVSRRGGTP
mmetsp:Transcript_136016/g.352677  ORF Transcript_136016/g.352677 Transcript_136016/m.352677 type:complete len:158 (+) Transcript_136016:89-562(+)